MNNSEQRPPLSDAERAAILQREFCAQDLEVGGRRFRRWSASDLITALELGLKLANPGALKGLSPADGMREFGALAYLLSMTPEEAEAQVAAPAAFKAGARTFLRTFDPLAFTAVIGWLTQRLEGANAAAVEVLPKPASSTSAPECPKKN